MNDIISTLKFVVIKPTILKDQWIYSIPKIEYNKHLYSGYHPIELLLEKLIFNQNNISLIYDTRRLILTNEDRFGINLETTKDWLLLLEKYWKNQIKDWTKNHYPFILTNIKTWDAIEQTEYAQLITEIRRNTQIKKQTTNIELTTITITQLNLSLDTEDKDILNKYTKIIYEKTEKLV